MRKEMRTSWGHARFPSTGSSGYREATPRNRPQILWDQYRKPLETYLMQRFALPRHSTEDLVADICSYFWEKRRHATFDPSKGRFRAYLKMFVTCFMIDRIRAENARRPRARACAFFGEIAIIEGFISRLHRDEALKIQDDKPTLMIGQILARRGHLTEQQIVRILRIQKGRRMAVISSDVAMMKPGAEPAGADEVSAVADLLEAAEAELVKGMTPDEAAFTRAVLHYRELGYETMEDCAEAIGQPVGRCRHQRDEAHRDLRASLSRLVKEQGDERLHFFDRWLEGG